MKDGMLALGDTEPWIKSTVSTDTCKEAIESQGIQLLGTADFFQSKFQEHRVPEGCTVKEMIDIIQPDPMLMADSIVFVGEHRIERDNWHRVRPKAGTVVTIRAHPELEGGGGGGKNPLRIVLTLAVVAAIFFFAGPLGAALLPAAATATQTFVGGLIISTVGGLLTQALAPIRPPSLGGLSGDLNQSPSLFLEGSQNNLRPYSVIPTVLGYYRFRLPLAAPTFTVSRGDANDLRMLMTAGYGRVTFNDLRIGETPLNDFNNFKIEIREGLDSDAPVTVYTNQVSQEAFSVLLEGGAQFTTRTTGLDADEISVDLVFPRGLVRFTNRNQLREERVDIVIQWREVGAADFQNLSPDIAEFTFEEGGFVVNNDGRIRFQAKRTTALRHGVKWRTGKRSQYEVRIRRITPDLEPEENASNEVAWTLLQSFTDEPPINPRKPLSLIALEFEATDQLNGTLSNFSAEVRSVVQDWDRDSETWVFRESNNPASLFRYVLQGPSNPRPVRNNDIDLEALQEFHEWCDDNNFTFNQVVDFKTSILSLIQDICSAGRARISLDTGRWGVAIDKQKPYRVQHITPRNSRNFKLSKPFVKLPDVLRVRFPDETANFQQNEVNVLVQGTEDAAELFEQIEFRGVTNPEHAYKLGRYYAFKLVNAPERFKVTLDFEYMAARVGDRVAITHDVLIVGRGSGRIKALQTNIAGDLVTGFVLDESFVFSTGERYGVTIRSDQTIEKVSRSYQVTAPISPEAQSTVSLISSISISDAPQPGDIYGFGILGEDIEEAQVIDIAPAENESAELTLEPYRDTLYTLSDNEPIPPYVPTINTERRLVTPIVQSIVSDESVLEVIQNTTLVRCVFEVTPETFEDAFLEVQQRSPGTNEPYQFSQIVRQDRNSITVGGVNTGDRLIFRLRWNRPGALIPGPWHEEPVFRIIGKGTHPQILQGLSVEPVGGSVLVRWDQPTELDVLYGGKVVFKISEETDPNLQNWRNAHKLGQQVQANALIANLPLKPGRVFARVIDDIGRQSEVFAIDTPPIDEYSLEGPGNTSVFQNPGFSGAKTNVGVVSSSLRLVPPANINVSDVPNIAALSNWDEFSGIALAGTYNFVSALDLGAVTNTRMTSVIRATAIDEQPTVGARTALIANWDDWDGLEDGSGAIDYWVEVRHTDVAVVSATENDWSDWKRLDQTEFKARSFQFRAQLRTDDRRFNVAISTLGIRYTNTQAQNVETLFASGNISGESLSGDVVTSTGTVFSQTLDASGPLIVGGNSNLSGDLDVTGNVTFDSGAVIEGTVRTAEVLIDSTQPRLRWLETDAPTDTGRWRWVSSAGTLALQSENDVGTAIENAIITRRSGTAVVNHEFRTGNAQRLFIDDNEVYLFEQILRMGNLRFRTDRLALASNTAGSIDFGQNVFRGWTIITASAVSTGTGMFFFRSATSSSTVQEIGTSTGVWTALANTVLTGTTGAVNGVTVACANSLNGELQIENRRGGSVTFDVLSAMLF